MNHRQKAEELFVVMRGYRTLEPCLKILSDALKEVEEETFARAVKTVGRYSAKYRRYLKDAKERSDVTDAVEFAHKDIATDEILTALREEAGKEGV